MPDSQSIKTSRVRFQDCFGPQGTICRLLCSSMASIAIQAVHDNYGSGENVIAWGGEFLGL